MRKRITITVVSGLLVIVVAASILRFLGNQASNGEHSIGQGVTVSGSNMPDNLSATSVPYQAPLDQKLAHIVSSTVQIGPSGKLRSVIIIHIPLTQTVPVGAKLIAMTAESMRGSWTPLAATLSQDGKSASVTVSHLSLFELFWLDLTALFQDFKQEFIDGLTANLFTKAKPPTCDNQSEARGDGYSIRSSTADTVFWCFGLKNGKRELVTVNNRSYVLAVQHPGLSVISSSQPKGALGRVAQLVDSIDREVMIFPGEEADFGAEVAVSQQAGIKTQADAGEQLMYSLETGVNALMGILTHFGFEKTFPVLDKMNKLLGLSDCFDIVQQSVRAGKVNFGDIMSTCLSPEDVVKAFDIWGVILAPIMALSSITAYFDSSIQGTVDIVLGRDQYEVIISRSLSSPCPTSAGVCLGIRLGDVDGDGKPDEVGLTYQPGSTQVVAHVVFATGATAEGVFDIRYYVGGNPEWLGLSDINGDGRDEIFLQVSPGEVQLAEVLQYYHGSLQRLRGNMPGTLYIGLGGSNNVVGIGCRTTTGSSQVITFGGATVGDNFNPTKASPVSGTLTVYQADASGAMLQVSQQTVTGTYGQVESMFGHCTGLNYP